MLDPAVQLGRKYPSIWRFAKSQAYGVRCAPYALASDPGKHSHGPWHPLAMAAEPSRRAVQLEYATLVWNAAEATAAVLSAVLAGSIALMAFGADSGIEISSAVVVLARLRAMVNRAVPDEGRERQALRVIAVLFFTLAAYVLTAALIDLVNAHRPSENALGIATCIAALCVMPPLAIAKRRTSDRLRLAGASGIADLLRADAAETILCAALSLSTLIGVVCVAAFRWWWTDPAASLFVVYFAVREGREAWLGQEDAD